MCRTPQGVLRDRVEFDAEREDRCYQADQSLGGLEIHQRAGMVELMRRGHSLQQYKVLMDLWERHHVEPLLKSVRQNKKENIRGWDDLKGVSSRS
jgi:hypothetical protein